MQISKRIKGLGIGIFFALAYSFFMFTAMSFGHGTYVFAIAAKLLGLGLLVFPVIGFLMADLRGFVSKVIFVTVMILHLALLTIFSVRYDWDGDYQYIEKTWTTHSPGSMLLAPSIYLVFQLTAWAFFIQSVRNPELSEFQ